MTVTEMAPNTKGKGALVLLFAVVGGIVAGVLVDQFYGTFTLPDELLNAPGPPYSAEVEQGIAEQTPRMNAKNAAISVGIASGLLVGFLAFGVGLARGTIGAAIVGLAVGLVLGGGAGVGGGFANAWVEEWCVQSAGFESVTQTIGEAVGDVRGFRKYAQTVLSHLAGWLPLVVILGVVVAGRDASRMFAYGGSGLGAMFVATALFPFLAAILFPTAKPEWHVPRGTSCRIFWTTLLSVCLAVSVIRSGIAPVADNENSSSD